ncbi:MAG: hypothetical protein ACTHJW_18230 [Streptosporangiaceae bacterium]
MSQMAIQESDRLAAEALAAPPSVAEGAMAEADMTRIRYGAWLIVAAFLLLGVVFGIAVWRYATASDVVAVVGSVATVAGTILGAFFGAQVGSAGKEAAEARRAHAERTTRMALGKLDPHVAEELIKKL